MVTFRRNNDAIDNIPENTNHKAKSIIYGVRHNNLVRMQFPCGKKKSLPEMTQEKHFQKKQI